MQPGHFSSCTLGEVEAALVAVDPAEDVVAATELDPDALPGGDRAADDVAADDVDDTVGAAVVPAGNVGGTVVDAVDALEFVVGEVAEAVAVAEGLEVVVVVKIVVRAGVGRTDPAVDGATDLLDRLAELSCGTVTTTLPPGTAAAGTEELDALETGVPGAAVPDPMEHPVRPRDSAARHTDARTGSPHRVRAAVRSRMNLSYTSGTFRPGRPIGNRAANRPCTTVPLEPFFIFRTRNEVTMTVHIRPALDTLPAYAPGRTVPGSIKLASNELSFPTLPAVSAAVAEAIGTGTLGINRYPDNAATALVTALADRVGVDRNRVIAGCGSVALCQQLVQITCSEGDEVMFGWRSFEAYPIVAQVAGASVIKVPVTADHELDLPAMSAAVTPTTRLIYICTPNNPTGTVVHRSPLNDFLNSVPEDILVVIDEAYREFDVDPQSPDGIAEATARPNVIALRTLSKAYGLAGLRVGYAVGDPTVITALSKVAIPFAVNSIAQAAALAALGAHDELKPRWQQVISERTRLTSALQDARFEVPPSQANFVWLPLRERAADFAAHCEAHKVIVRAFPDATGGVRVSIGSPEENDAFLAAARSFAP